MRKISKNTHKDTIYTGFKNIENGLKKIGFSDSETEGILGNNWYNFYKLI